MKSLKSTGAINSTAFYIYYWLCRKCCVSLWRQNKGRKVPGTVGHCINVTPWPISCQETRHRMGHVGAFRRQKSLTVTLMRPKNHHLTPSQNLAFFCVCVCVFLVSLKLYVCKYVRQKRERGSLNNVMTTSIIWHNQDESLSTMLHKKIPVPTSASPRLEALQTELQTACRYQTAAFKSF